jgi:hypothetical protein
VGQVDDLADGRLRGRQAQRTTGALRAGVPANERANAGAVDGRDAGEIDDEMLVAAPYQLPKLAFECLGGAAGEERFARRQKQTIADGLCLTRN